MNDLVKRIFELSYKYQSSHIGSCITSVDLIDEIYSFKKKDEPFILSNGHAGLALYVVLEKHEKKDADHLFKKHGTHPNRNLNDGIWCSTGSLGHGFPISVGMATANRQRKVYAMTSDGELAEGSMWEAARIASEQQLNNLKLFVNANGFSAYGEVDPEHLVYRFQAFGWGVLVIDGHSQNEISEALKTNLESIPLAVIAKTTTRQYPFLKGLSAHYVVLTKEVYEKKILRASL